MQWSRSFEQDSPKIIPSPWGLHCPLRVNVGTSLEKFYDIVLVLSNEKEQKAIKWIYGGFPSAFWTTCPKLDVWMEKWPKSKHPTMETAQHRHELNVTSIVVNEQGEMTTCYTWPVESEGESFKNFRKITHHFRGIYRIKPQSGK